MGYGRLDPPEPVIAADADFNRGVDRAEVRAAALTRCHLLDQDGSGLFAGAELPTRVGPGRQGVQGRPAMSPPDE